MCASVREEWSHAATVASCKPQHLRGPRSSVDNSLNVGNSRVFPVINLYQSKIENNLSEIRQRVCVADMRCVIPLTGLASVFVC